MTQHDTWRGIAKFQERVSAVPFPVRSYPKGKSESETIAHSDPGQIVPRPAGIHLGRSLRSPDRGPGAAKRGSTPGSAAFLT
jgi:hypothetical protein